jgi:hypothetical protein
MLSIEIYTMVNLDFPRKIKEVQYTKINLISYINKMSRKAHLKNVMWHKTTLRKMRALIKNLCLSQYLTVKTESFNLRGTR